MHSGHECCSHSLMSGSAHITKHHQGGVVRTLYQRIRRTILSGNARVYNEAAKQTVHQGGRSFRTGVSVYMAECVTWRVSGVVILERRFFECRRAWTIAVFLFVAQFDSIGDTGAI